VKCLKRLSNAKWTCASARLKRCMPSIPSGSLPLYKILHKQDASQTERHTQKKLCVSSEVSCAATGGEAIPSHNGVRCRPRIGRLTMLRANNPSSFLPSFSAPASPALPFANPSCAAYDLVQSQGCDGAQGIVAYRHN
jgi:hypothetical protein